MSKKPKLTQALIDRPGALLCPDKLTHCEYPAGDRSGLYLDVRTDSEVKSYYLRAKNQAGKSYSTFLGRTSVLTLKEAKAKVLILKADIAKGKDLQSESRARKKVLTWNQFYQEYYKKHAKQHLRSWANLDEMHRLRISKRFGHLQLNKFSRREVQQWLNELKASGLADSTCSHYGKMLRQALNLGIQWELLEVNPIANIKLFSSDNRVENVMSTAQLKALLSTLNNVSDRRKVASLVIKFLLFTGARVNEALHAQWADIDRKNRTWTVQATNSKSKQRRSIPLNDAAIAVLDELKSEDRSEWLFTSPKGGGTQRLTTISKVYQEIRKDAGLPWLRLHDLRHNFASMLVNSGRTLYEVQQILGHSDSKVTERYAHLSTATLQDAANAVSDTVNAAINSGS
jgi:integrase